ncbi:MAG: hypothetical protein C0600_16500 [Ignavibacteria bacterium]|nr:MAG: hypothetical protein C0600_16500 [Ignavibacteria bacterium]
MKHNVPFVHLTDIPGVYFCPYGKGISAEDFVLCCYVVLQEPEENDRRTLRRNNDSGNRTIMRFITYHNQVID